MGKPLTQMKRVLVTLVIPAMLLASPGQGALAAGVTLSLPETVDPGQSVPVMIEAGEPGATLEVWGPDRGDGYDRLVSGQPATGPEARIPAPAVPGSYELRYLAPNGKVLARAGLEVAVPPVSLSVPDPLGAGYDSRLPRRPRPSARAAGRRRRRTSSAAGTGRAGRASGPMRS